MDERLWATCVAPEAMLDYAVRRSRVTERKARLFACACCLRIGPLLNDLARHAVEVAERFADGLATEAERRGAEDALQAFADGWVYPTDNTWADDARVYFGVLAALHAVTFYHDYVHGPLQGAGFAAQQAAYAVGARDAASTEERCAPEKARQADLVRCVFGNPFRPAAFDPAWRAPAAVDLAAGMYESRMFDRMPEVAAALEQVGCGVPELLAHCRGPGPHVRGCWVLDTVLGRG